MRVLTVCTHNRTRSVLMNDRLGRRLIEAGCQPAMASAGFASAGQPPTDMTVRLLAGCGHTLVDHRSRLVDDTLVELADVIVCAERDHVITIAGRYPGSFARTFTMPELARLGELVGPASGDLPGWLGRIGAHRRTGMDYLDADAKAIGEIVDPTGSAPSLWADVFVQIDKYAIRIARAMAT